MSKVEIMEISLDYFNNLSRQNREMKEEIEQLKWDKSSENDKYICACRTANKLRKAIERLKEEIEGFMGDLSNIRSRDGKNIIEIEELKQKIRVQGTTIAILEIHAEVREGK